MKRITLIAALAVGLVGAFAVPHAALAGDSNYIALGDSYAFGYLDATHPVSAPPGNLGDQGYVAPFADFLATLNGGVRPTVTNLAVPGETTTSFFAGAPTLYDGSVFPYPAGLVDAPARNQGYNQNYTAPFTKQSDLLTGEIAAIHGGGGNVDYVTIQMGGDDFLPLFIEPAFTGLTPAQQNQVLGAQTLRLQANYTVLLSALKAAAPEAKVFVVGYADPFAGLGPLNPLAGISTPLTLSINAQLSSLATSFGDTYVDIFQPFLGNELALTSIGTSEGGIPNFHPNAAGYAVIAGQLQLAASTSAPEPTTLTLLALTIPVGLIIRRRARG